MPFQAIQLPAGWNLSHIVVGIFGLLLALFWIYNFFIFYHLIRFGVGKLPKQLAFFSMVGSLSITLLALIALLGT